MTDPRSPTALTVEQQTQPSQSLQPSVQNVIMVEPLKVKLPETYERTKRELKAFFSQI